MCTSCSMTAENSRLQQLRQITCSGACECEPKETQWGLDKVKEIVRNKCADANSYLGWPRMVLSFLKYKSAEGFPTEQSLPDRFQPVDRGSVSRGLNRAGCYNLDTLVNVMRPHRPPLDGHRATCGPQASKLGNTEAGRRTWRSITALSRGGGAMKRFACSRYPNGRIWKHCTCISRWQAASRRRNLSRSSRPLFRRRRFGPCHSGPSFLKSQT